LKRKESDKNMRQQQIRIPKEAERFYECSRQKVIEHGYTLLNNDVRTHFDLKFHKRPSEGEFSGCFTLEFKKGLKQISHVVTV